MDSHPSLVTFSLIVQIQERGSALFVLSSHVLLALIFIQGLKPDGCIQAGLFDMSVWQEQS
jgi:hypothetical protein